jgi:hypothetical protein
MEKLPGTIAGEGSCGDWAGEFWSAPFGARQHATSAYKLRTLRAFIQREGLNPPE